jgi:FkbM family methyltransferase
MDFETDTVSVGNFRVSVIKDDSYIGGCLRRGYEWDGWMHRDLPYIYKPGTDILDIGGNIGWNAIMFSNYGPVHTFEPMFYKVIQKNVDQNKLTHPVTIHPYGLSHEETTLNFFIPKTEMDGLRNYGGGSFRPLTREELGPQYAGYEETGTELPVKRLDDVYHGTPSVIKMDVERHELEVIQGAWNTISKHKPAMYIEILDPKNDAIVKMLEPLGYTMIERPENNYLFICQSSPS